MLLDVKLLVPQCATPGKAGILVGLLQSARASAGMALPVDGQAASLQSEPTTPSESIRKARLGPTARRHL